MPPNKHDLGAKIQILNPNAPNYLFFKINLVRFQKKLANSWTFSECKWETLKLRIFELILNYFWIPKLAIFGGFWKSENDILKTRIILTFWKFKIGNLFDILKISKSQNLKFWHFEGLYPNYKKIGRVGSCTTVLKAFALCKLWPPLPLLIKCLVMPDATASVIRLFQNGSQTKNWGENRDRKTCCLHIWWWD